MRTIGIVTPNKHHRSAEIQDGRITYLFHDTNFRRRQNPRNPFIAEILYIRLSNTAMGTFFLAITLSPPPTNL